MRFVWVEKTGSTLPNGSYDGAIGILADSKADAYLR